jgi:plasmid replication initiation protein
MNNTLPIPFKLKENNYQPNLITESRQEFSENEKKIVSLVINQLRKDALIDWNGQNLEFLIPVAELTDKNHDRIKDSIEGLITKKIVQNFGEKGKKEGEKEIIYKAFIPFPKIEYYKIRKNSYVRVTMLSDVVPLFIELGKHYTKYSLELILSFKSVYSQRFYEIVMMHLGRNQKSFRYSVDEIKFFFNCPESYTFDEIRKRALLPAQKELLEKANIMFNFEPSRKEGKKIIELSFTVKTKTEMAIDAILNEAEEFKRGTPLEQRDYILRLLNNYSFSRKQQDEIMTDPEKWSIFLKIDSEIYNGLRTDIDNPTAYIAASLGFNMKSKKK